MNFSFKKTGFLLLIAVFFTACKTIQYIPIETIKEVSVHDTTVLHRTDTLVQVPEVSISDFIDLKDTLIMRGTLSESRSWVDSTAMVLKGRLVQTGKIPVQIVEKERVVYRDSLVKQEIPAPFEVEKIVKVVPWFWRVMSVIGILALAYIAFRFFVLKK